MLFSMFDDKASTFGALIALENADVARRHFIVSMLSNEKSPVRDFPDDYILYELGDFDKFTGKFTLHETPIKVMSGFEAVEAAKAYMRKKMQEEVLDGSRCEESSNFVGVESNN